MKTGRIWVFDENRLEESLQTYQAAAIDAYPKQEERIRITVEAMRDFLHSEYAEPLVMGSLEE